LLNIIKKDANISVISFLIYQVFLTFFHKVLKIGLLPPNFLCYDLKVKWLLNSLQHLLDAAHI
ncbi:hypothetical protein D5S30_14100, partial [Listeria monocytogenes]|nr:hypothetical protein [Listeria monocytogenes]MDC95865.1 hypothetical protein [Listeria monocytogenes]